MDFVVGGYPDNENKLSEVKLLKVAALYGDSITLISPMYQTYDSILVDVNSRNSDREIINSIIKLLPFCENIDSGFAESSSVIYEFRDIINSKKFKNIPAKNKLEHRRMLKKTYSDILTTLNEFMGSDRIKDICRLKKENRFKVQKFNTRNMIEDNFINEYIFRVSDSISQAYPLLDNRLGRLIENLRSSMNSEIRPMEKRSIISSGFARNIMLELPAFEQASMDEIIDVRKELDKYLIRFRSSILTYSEEISVLPWDVDFNLNCEEVFIKEVEPAILELKEKVNDNKMYKNLFGSLMLNDNFLDKLGSIVLSFATYISANAIDYSIDKKILAATTFGLSELGKNGFKTYEMNKIIKRNNIYFYYKTAEKFRTR